MKFIDDAASRSLDKFYLEVLAAAARNRLKKPKLGDAEGTDKKGGQSEAM